MLRKEVPFKSIKITLSEEAINRLAQLRSRGSLRSDSATIEECIRTIYDISIDIAAEVDRTIRGNQKFMPVHIQAETLRRIAIRMLRFIPFTEETMKRLRTEEPSAGP